MAGLAVPITAVPLVRPRALVILGTPLASAAAPPRVATKLEFFGKTLFIPSFFIVTGLLIDPVAFVGSLIDHFPLALGIISALLAGKWIAAASVGRAFAYAPAARLTMWALTPPQVAAPFAAAIVAYDTRNAAGERVLDGTMLNAVLVLMLATSILRPVLTECFAPRMLDDTPMLRRDAMTVITGFRLFAANAQSARSAARHNHPTVTPSNKSERRRLK